MHFYNTYAGFLYRHLFLTPPKPPASFSLRGKTGLVTGSNTGLGYQACAQLLSLGLSHLILAVRSVAKGESVRESLLASLPTGSKQEPQQQQPPVVIEVWDLDLSDYASTIAFVEKLKKRSHNVRLDFAILNAGVSSFEFHRNPLASNEVSIQTNWLSTALLTLLLLPELDKQRQVAVADGPNRNDANDNDSSHPVLSIMGSETAAWVRFNEARVATTKGTSILAALNDETNIVMGDRYYTSKLFQELFFLELVDRRRQKSSSSSETGLTILNLVNPGFCYGSELHRGATGTVFVKILETVKRIIGRSVQVGAKTPVHGAVLAGPESNGRYLSDCRVAPFADYAESRKGKIIKRKVWDEMGSEVGKVVDIGKVLEEI